MKIYISKKLEGREHLVLIGAKEADYSSYLSENELDYLQERLDNEAKSIFINQYDRVIFILVKNEGDSGHKLAESIRGLAPGVSRHLNKLKVKNLAVVSLADDKHECLAFAEGLVLCNYQFLKYFKDKDKKANSIAGITLVSNGLEHGDIEDLEAVTGGVYKSRDLVNEPVSFLNSVQLTEEFKSMARESGFSLKVFDKKKIESLKMGGLLAVNKGSIDPPTFSILEWKPKNAKNKKPLVIVGKGIVFDTGGLSLKPTLNSMDEMKSDMAGAAAVGGLLYAIAKSKVPVHVVGLVPSTDNRHDGNAYAPGDVITMYDGTTVEVLNTDAEGRMILADALSYAKDYNPGLVIDIATLTGAAAMAIGQYGVVAMGNAGEKYMNSLKESGDATHERIAEFPFWDDYKELLKSDIADLKNIGGRVAGAITAGKFLEHFTDYPYIHLDIAGPAFLKKNDSYRGKGGTGVAVRLLYHFIKNKFELDEEE